MVKKVEDEVKTFDIRDIAAAFKDRNQAHELSELGYNLGHYLFDLLKDSSSGRDLTVGELSDAAYKAAESLGERYVVIKKKY